MPVPVTRPPVRDLVFQLYGRPLHPELFEIAVSRRVQHEDYQITVFITRTGHVISWEDADVHLTEVTAAFDQELPERRRLLSYRIRHEHSVRLTCAHNVHYQSTFQLETLPPDLFLHVHDEIVNDGSKRGLLHSFRSPQRLSVSPLGFVTIEARPGCIFLSTFHTFPG